MVNNVYYEIGASEVYGGITTLAVVAAIAVVLRMVARRVAAASYWWGDLSIVVALVLKWALTACYYAELHHSGLGRHTRAIGGPVTESQLELYFKVNCSFTALAVRFEEDWSIAQEMGSWNNSEYIPNLISTSRYLGKIPASLCSLDVIDWIPIDIAAQVILDLLSYSNKSDVNRGKKKRRGSEPLRESPRLVKKKREGNTGAQEPVDDRRSVMEDTTTESSLQHTMGIPSANVFHISNPSKSSWPELVPTLCELLPTIRETTSYSDWLSSLRVYLESKVAKDSNYSPMSSLLPVFEKIEYLIARPTSKLSTTQTEKASPLLRSSEPMRKEWLANWFKQ